MELLLLQMLHQGGGTEELDALACFNNRSGNASGQMRFANARRTEEEAVLGLVNPFRFSGEFLNG